MKIEVSNGEIADKLTIIEIKLAKIKDESKLVNIRNEFRELDGAIKTIIKREDPLYQELLQINNELWVIEDDIRDCERNKDFGARFVELARAVYFTNDRRSEVKKKINLQTGSNLVEEKSYESY